MAREYPGEELLVVSVRAWAAIMKGEPSVAAISGSAVREEPAAPPHLTPGSQSSPPAAVSFLHHSRHHHAGLLRRLSRYASRVVPLGAIREHETRILPEGDAGAGAAAPTSYGATMDGTNDLQEGGSSRGARRRRNAEGAKDGSSTPRGDNIPVCHLARSDSYERAISRNLATSSHESFTKLPAPAKRTKPRAPSRPSSRKKSNVSDVSRSSNTSNESNTAGTPAGLAGGESRADPPSPGAPLRGALVPPTAAPRYSLKKALDQPEGTCPDVGFCGSPFARAQSPGLSSLLLRSGYHKPCLDFMIVLHDYQ